MAMIKYSLLTMFDKFQNYVDIFMNFSFSLFIFKTLNKSMKKAIISIFYIPMKHFQFKVQRNLH